MTTPPATALRGLVALAERVGRRFDGPVTEGLCCMCGEEPDHEFHRGDSPECIGELARRALAAWESQRPLVADAHAVQDVGDIMTTYGVPVSVQERMGADFLAWADRALTGERGA